MMQDAAGLPGDSALDLPPVWSVVLQHAAVDVALDSGLPVP